MGHEVDTMSFTGATPWHGLGFKVGNNLSPAQMLKAAKIDWTVSKRPMYFQKADGESEYIKGEFALVRDSDETFLSAVGSTWKPVQNDASIEFFKKFVVAGHMTMETAGSLQNGKYVWALAKIGADFTLGKEDEVKGYLLMSNPHVHGKSRLYQFTPIRVVCWNTLNFALGAGLKGNAGAFRMSHATEFNDDVKAQAEVALGLAKEQMAEFKVAATLLSKKKAKPEAVEEYFCEVLQFDPKNAVKNKDESIREPKMLSLFRTALTHAPGQQMPTALGTWWGPINAVTNVVDFQIGRDRGASLRTAWMGQKSSLKRRAFDLAIKAAS